MTDHARNNSSSYRVDPTKTVVYRSSFPPRTTIDWNNLEQEVVSSKTIENFKTQICRCPWNIECSPLSADTMPKIGSCQRVTYVSAHQDQEMWSNSLFVGNMLALFAWYDYLHSQEYPTASMDIITGNSQPTETLKWLSLLPIFMQESFWWWQCSDSYIISLSPHLHTPFHPFSPSLISLKVSVDVKHHDYLLTYRFWLNSARRRDSYFSGKKMIAFHGNRCSFQRHCTCCSDCTFGAAEKPAAGRSGQREVTGTSVVSIETAYWQAMRVGSDLNLWNG